tara:strand:- start:1442 stop:1924 length:483 start_codon:yes stop_codon:yes gene_type:complete
MSTTTPRRKTTTSPRGCTNFKLRQLLRRVSRIYDAELAHAGLKGTQYSLLSHLVSMSPITPGELARRMEMDPSTLTRNVRLLTDQGWVERIPGADTRSHRLAITAGGRDKHAQAKAHWKRAQLALNAQLGEPQVATLHALVDDALAALHTTDEPTAEVRK